MREIAVADTTRPQVKRDTQPWGTDVTDRLNEAGRIGAVARLFTILL